MAEKHRREVGLPPRIFMYTVDQIAGLLELSESYVRNTLLFYEKREPGVLPRGRLRAINVAPEGETPEWRVPEGSLLAYLRAKGMRYSQGGYGR